MRSEERKVVVVVAPEFYNDLDFCTWLNTYKEHDIEPIATWHKKGDPPDTYSDVFIHFCVGTSEDSSNPAMPRHCQKQLEQFLRDKGYQEGQELLVWLQNLED